MKNSSPISAAAVALVGAVVMVLVVVFWWMGRGPSELAGPGDRGPRPGSEVAPVRRGESLAPQVTRAEAEALPEWALGSDSMPRSERVGPRGLPPVVGELAGLCFGRTPESANTIEVKQKVLELMNALTTMSVEDQEKLAQYFRDSDDPAFKFHMMVALRARAGAPFVDAVADYYESDPHMVAEALQWMAGRAPEATAEAFNGILAHEIDPARREMLIARAGYLGLPAAEPMMTRLFEEGAGTVDRRLAVTALARTPTDSARALLRSVVDGDYEEATYAVGSTRPTQECLSDVRGHAVMGLLMNGDDDIVEGLWQRFRAGNANDPIGGYVKELFATVQSKAWVDRVVDEMMQRGALVEEFVLYLSVQAEAKDLPNLRRLQGLDLAPAERGNLELILNRLK